MGDFDLQDLHDFQLHSQQPSAGDDLNEPCEIFLDVDTPAQRERERERVDLVSYFAACDEYESHSRERATRRRGSAADALGVGVADRNRRSKEIVVPRRDLATRNRNEAGEEEEKEEGMKNCPECGTSLEKIAGKAFKAAFCSERCCKLMEERKRRNRSKRETAQTYQPGSGRRMSALRSTLVRNVLSTSQNSTYGAMFS